MKQINLNSTIKTHLDIDLAKIEALCIKWQIIEFALFGSVLRDDFNSNSDIDCLVSFEPDQRISLLDLETLEEQLQLLFNRPVDVVSKKAIEQNDNWIRRQNILNNYEVIYVKR
ncbi:MAG: nucleotidyltransferase family protein [Crocosphaera sp.]